MKLTTEQDSHFGASEYTDMDYVPTGRSPEEASKNWISLWVIGLLLLCSCCAVFQLGLEAVGL